MPNIRFTLVLAVLCNSALHAQQAAPRVTNGGLPSVSPDGGAIAFTSNRDGAWDVYLASPDGQHIRRVTNTPALESAPFWTRTMQLVFSTWTDNASTIYSVSATAPEPKIIGKADGRSPIISPDGKSVLFSRGQYPALHLVAANLDGSGAKVLSGEPAAQFNAVYSPDQSQVAFARADSMRQLQIWVMNADGSHARQLTWFKPDDGSAQWPAWSPDGSRIAVQSGKYNRERPAENTAHIWIVDVKTGSPVKLNPHATPYLDETPSWFPDGKRLAFQSDRTGRMEIWVMNADGTAAVQVTR